MAEATLVQRLRQREEIAMQTLLSEYGSLIKSVVYRYLGTLTQYREECINDVLWKIWQHIDQYQEEKCSFSGWIAAVCRYNAIDYRRKYARRLETCSIEELQEQGIQIAAPTPQVFSAETEAILAEIKESDRMLLISLYGDGENADTLAARLGISSSALYKRAERAKERVRRQQPIPSSLKKG